MIAPGKLRAMLLALFVMLALIYLLPVLFQDENTIDMANQLLPPGIGHPFGTDNFGRDHAQRIIAGLRYSLTLAIVSQVICIALGFFIGMIAGYTGGLVDALALYLINVFLAVPGSLSALVVIVIFGSSSLAIIIAISLTGWVGYARLVRGQTVSLKERDFVTGARAAGASIPYILFRHIFPNLFLPLIPLFTLMLGHAMMTISSLSFLGLGVQPPAPEIGLMLRDSISWLGRAPWLIIFPGLAMAVCVWVLNHTGNMLRDWLDVQDQGMAL
jgi:peptide/nickel transport system permease protein